jgi:hypothetical protein
MSRRKELKNCTVFLQDGFSGVVDIDDSSISEDDATLLLDQATIDLHDSATLVPVGARFTSENDPTIRTVTARNSNSQYQLTIGADTTGTFTLTVNGVTTSALNGTDNASTILAAIVGLSSVGAGNASISGTDPFVIEFIGDLVDTDVTMSGDPTDLDNFAFAELFEGGTTWSITFTPALDAVAAAAVMTGDEITFLPQRVSMKIGEGNIEWTENDEPIFDTDRGILDGVRSGTEVPMDVTTSFVFNWLRASSGQPITVYEALRRLGNAATWHNAAEDPCEPYCVDIGIIDVPPCGSEQTEVIILPRFYPTSVNANVDDAQVNLSGRCNATRPIITREDA